MSSTTITVCDGCGAREALDRDARKRLGWIELRIWDQYADLCCACCKKVAGVIPRVFQALQIIPLPRRGGE